MIDEDWPEPEPWGWKGLSIVAVVIIAAALVLHWFGVLAPKPHAAMLVTQYKIPGTNEYCHPAKFYSTGHAWYCTR